MLNQFIYFFNLFFIMENILERNSFGQGAVEYLLILGAAIIIVVIVIVLIMSLAQTGQEQVNTQISDGIYDDLKRLIPEPIFLNGKGYSKKSSMVKGLIGLWHLDETSETNSEYALDYSGYENHGSVMDAIQGVEDSTGVAYSFFNTKDYIKIEHSPIFNPKNVSISLWFNTNSQTDDQMIISKTEFGGFNLNFNENRYCFDSLCFLLRATGAAPYYSVTIPNTEILEDEWYYVVATYDGVTMKLYLNGVLANENIVNGGDIIYVYDVPLCIGLETQGSGCGQTHTGLEWDFSGKMKEIAIWNRALTAREVLELWNNSQ